MNPIDLIRELAAMLEKTEDEVLELYSNYPGIERTATAELLTRAQAFLAAQPVVVELKATRVTETAAGRCLYRGTAPVLADAVSFRVGESKLLSELPTGPCTVHVIVTPGAR